jgi:hypothetical protein
MVLKIRLNMALATATAMVGYGYGPYSNGYTDEEKTTAFLCNQEKLQTKGKNNSRFLN